MLNEILSAIGFDERNETLGFKCTVLGEKGIYIEGAKKVLQFNEESVRLATSGGFVVVTGNSLTLRTMTKTDVIVCGNIGSICFEKAGKA